MVIRAFALGALALALPGAAAAQSQMPTPVETQQLTQLDGFSVGALSQAQGAFGADLWRNSDASVIAVLLDRLPAAPQSAAAQMLARRVLASGAEAPRGESAAAARERFEALGKLGLADDLAVMASGAGAALNDPLIAQYAAQAELARGRRAEACARGRAAQAEQPPPFILRLRAYCAAVGGDRAAADLALELARAQNAADAWYTGAVAAAGGAPAARPPAARYENSLTTQLSLAARLTPGPNPLNNASTLALLSLARADTAPQPIRAQAAALAYIRGVLPAADARAIIAATPAEVTSNLPALASALRRVQAAPGSPDAATAIADLLGRASSAAEFARFSAFFKDDIAAFTAAPSQAGALLFARAAIATGDAVLGRRLTQAARDAGAEAAGLATLDAALAVLAGARGQEGVMAVRRRIDAAGASQARAAARDVAILSAIGLPADEGAQAFVLANAPTGGARADAGAMLALSNAVERRAGGEVALLAIVAGGEAGPARLDAESLERVIRALRAAGLADDARRFAVEALLAGAPG
ncbi:exonuclease SbcC [alpha proteobacterium U9-1i]|nr:exonuclease SbcC [alpha proteobacterium U9-1i]